jgi:hypothetical protein
VQSSIDVELLYAKSKTGTSAKLSAYLPENLREYVHYEISDSVLTIRTERCLSSVNKAVFAVVNNEFRQVMNLGSGNIIGSAAIAGDSVCVINSGSGRIELSLRQENVRMDNRGSGDVVLSGFTRNITATLQGSGKFDAINLRADKVIARNNGSGLVSIACAGSADLYLYGSGNIELYGDPASVRQTVEGSGAVIRNTLITR